jgi:hypothetical protein
MHLIGLHICIQETLFSHWSDVDKRQSLVIRCTHASHLVKQYRIKEFYFLFQQILVFLPCPLLNYTLTDTPSILKYKHFFTFRYHVWPFVIFKIFVRMLFILL